MEQTIYKLDSKEKLRYLTISTEGNIIIQQAGLIDGKGTINRSTCIGKNIGKANETTPEEQAVQEAQAKLKKKLEEGYYETKELALKGTLILPMLAKSYEDEKDKIIYPCFVQPKLDSLRCLKQGENMVSRTAKKIDTMYHIARELNHIHDTLDGELYAHGYNFQENMRMIKKYRKGESELIKHHVYDIVLPNLPFRERYILLKSIIEMNKPENVVLVPTYEISNETDLIRYHAQFIEEGYEGTMVRWGIDGYKVNGRSSNLLKYKDFKDIACKIIDVVPSEKRPIHGSFICKLDGKTFGTGMRFSHKEREDTLINKDKYIGEIAEIRFFEFTEDGLPRFPVCVGLRLDK